MTFRKERCTHNKGIAKMQADLTCLSTFVYAIMMHIQRHETLLSSRNKLVH